MPELAPMPDVDYLVIGHLSKDLTPDGPVLGGTAAYAGLTARALGLQVGIVTSAGPDLDLSALDGVCLECRPSRESTTFENRYTSAGRIQFLHARALDLDRAAIPPHWRSPHLVHLAPIAAEVPATLADQFPGSLVGVTPQGWMRAWDAGGLVRPTTLPSAEQVLGSAGAVVLSLEDLQGDEGLIEELSEQCRLLVVTEGARGARVYWNRDQRRVPAPKVEEIDPTGSGDIFAAAFFIRLFQTRDPWEAARYANFLASASVTRRGIHGTPTQTEVESAGIQVFP